MARSSVGTHGPNSEWYLFRIGTFDHPVLIPLDRNEVVIGRVTNKYLKKSPFVSRKHACFFKSSGNWSIEDLGSTNGTFVNNVKINSNCTQPVCESDIVGLGMAAATSEERFSFKLCKNSNFHRKSEEENTISANQFANALHTSDTSNSDSTIEICDSLLDKTQLSALEHSQAQHTRPRKVAKNTRLAAKLELSEGSKQKLQNTTNVQHRENDVPNEIGINNSRDIPILERKTQIISTTKKCNVSNSQSFYNNETIPKRLGPEMSLCSTNNAEVPMENRNDKQGSSSDYIKVSTLQCSSKYHSNAKFDELPQTRNLQKTVHISDYNTIKNNNVDLRQQNSTENDAKCKSTTANEVSISIDMLPELIEIEGSHRRRSVCSNHCISMQNKPMLIDLSIMKEDKRKFKTITEIELHTNKKRKNHNVITVPDDGTSIIESIEIKEEVITLSDCDDDCIVIDDESNKSVPILNQLNQSTTDKVKDDTAISQPSCSNYCANTRINPLTGNFIELDESSNDTHFSETVDDCVDFEATKPHLNIDENKLLSRLSWPDLPAD